MATAVANWVEESCGLVEARVFSLAAPLEAESVPSALLTLELECLHGMEEQAAALSAAACSPAQAWRVLFAAASAGGAYNSGSYGAYGRLAAWRSLGALAGSPESSTFGAIEARARECIWHGFSAGTEWFARVAWNIGLAALSPDRRRLPYWLRPTPTDMCGTGGYPVVGRVIV
ncbi:DUF6183 family protein [Streptomyces sp. NPDC056534]|uniref:DUF6183 family protein n=1 Tax=Streptomyces sp. NPDC056534 TaxID=3345857 RepID=UPI0036CDED4A